MADLADVVAYLCAKYPNKGELSKARVTKMVYLADWKAALDEGEQITDIQWKFHHYGPWTDDVVDKARSAPELEVEVTENLYGDFKELIQATPDASWDSLDEEDMEILDHVIDETAPLYWNAFIKLIYSTYPILASDRYSDLDLEDLAKRYRKELRQLKAAQ